MKEKPSTENEQKCCSGLELAVREQTLRICPLGIDHAERTFYNLLEFSTAYLAADQVFQKFREMQTELRRDDDKLSKAKKELRHHLGELSEKLNRYLASEYGIDDSNIPDATE